MVSERGDEVPLRAFVTTHWSVVLSAKGKNPEEVHAALEKLSRIYWLPLYAFVRGRGYQRHDAEDLTQGFFHRLLSKDSFQSVDRSKGKFRSYLLGALEHFLANERRNSHAQKRGGKFQFLSLDDDSAENQYLQVATPGLSPEQLFDQQWAVTLLNQAVTRLREEFVAEGKAEQFEAIKIFLTGEKQRGAYAELAKKLGMTQAALKMAVTRMKQRYGLLLRAEIANTVSSPEEVEEELRALFAALSF